MENAAIIRKAARDLMVRQHSPDMFGFEYVEYFNISGHNGLAIK